MTTGDSIEHRGHKLEDAFFHRVDKKLLEQMKQQASKDEKHKALATACPWATQAMLDSLDNAKISPTSLVSLTLVPLIRVAWADGRVELKERDAILKAANENKLAEGSAGHTMLASWLEEAPEDTLFEAWKQYAAALAAELSPEAAAALKSQVVGQARDVAKATGGILGIHSISASEESVLAEIEAAFD